MSALTDQLQNQAVCIDRCIPDGEKLAVLIGVFYQLYLNGTGGGGGLPTGNQNANTVLAGPTSGGAASPTFRNLVNADLLTSLTPQLSALGLGTAPSIAGSLVTATSIIAGTFFRGNGNALGAGTVIDWSTGDFFSATLTGNVIFTFANTGIARIINVSITGDASHTVTWPSVRWPGGVAPVQTLNATDVYTFVVMPDAHIYGSVVQNMS